PEPPPALPETVTRLLAARLLPGETVLRAFSPDLHLDGTFGPGYVLATSQRLCAFSIDSDELTSWSVIPLEATERMGIQEFIGTAVLEAVTSERGIRLARFTKARLDSAWEFLRGVQPLLSAPAEEGWHDDSGWRSPKEGLCEACGQPIPRWFAGVCPNCLDKRRTLSRLLLRVKSYWPWIALGMVMLLALTATGLVQPILTKYLIDDVLPNPRSPRGDLPLLWRILGLILGLNVLGAVLTGVRGYLMAWLGERVTLDLRQELYDHIQTLSVAFYDSKQTGWIMDRVGNDTSNLQDFMTDAMQDFTRDVIQLVCIAGVLFAMSPPLAAATLLPLPFITYLSWRFVRRAHRMYHLMWRRRSGLTALLSDVIPGVRVVKAFAQEHREKERYQGRSRDYMNASLITARYANWVWPTTNFLGSIGFAVVWGYGGYLAVKGQGVTTGTLFAFIGYLWQFYGPLDRLSRMTQRVQRAATSAQRVFEVLDTKPSVPEPAIPREMPLIKGAVEFRDVTFGYEPHQAVLKGVSFTVRPGEMIGLVGASGAGKSTTINLISRFYDVVDGAILVDGIDIRDVTLHSLRSQIGVVLQEPFLFSGTIAENISYGNPGATTEEILDAAQAANAHEFIVAMPEGYDTLVGERGARLSGGERQR
ncbi:MAG TPA: ABC transporter ATP-binding protein, partial [Armatimonadota bacterium]